MGSMTARVVRKAGEDGFLIRTAIYGLARQRSWSTDSFNEGFQEFLEAEDYKALIDERRGYIQSICFTGTATFRYLRFMREGYVIKRVRVDGRIKSAVSKIYKYLQEHHSDLIKGITLEDATRYYSRRYQELGVSSKGTRFNAKYRHTNQPMTLRLIVPGMTTGGEYTQTHKQYSTVEELKRGIAEFSKTAEYKRWRKSREGKLPFITITEVGRDRKLYLQLRLGQSGKGEDAFTKKVNLTTHTMAEAISTLYVLLVERFGYDKPLALKKSVAYYTERLNKRKNH